MLEACFELSGAEGLLSAAPSKLGAGTKREASFAHSKGTHPVEQCPPLPAGGEGMRGRRVEHSLSQGGGLAGGCASIASPLRWSGVRGVRQSSLPRATSILSLSKDRGRGLPRSPVRVERVMLNTCESSPEQGFCVVCMAAASMSHVLFVLTGHPPED